MGIGRYSDVASFSKSYGPFAVKGASYSPDVYTIEITGSGGGVGSVTWDLKFGPQGRNFYSALDLSGAVEGSFAGIDVDLLSVSFSGDRVEVRSDAGFQGIYTRDQLEPNLVVDLVRVGVPPTAAENLAEVIGVGMDGLDKVADELKLDSIKFGNRPGTIAKFLSAPGGLYDPDIPNAKIEIQGEDTVIVTTRDDSVTDVSGHTIVRTYVYTRDFEDGMHNASEIISAYEEYADGGSIAYILSEFFNYSLDDEQVEEGKEYYLSGIHDAMEAAFDNSLNFGTGGATEAGIVDGTASADVIDETYVDPDGDMISD